MRGHHGSRHHFRARGYLGRIGPGLVTGAADDDPSGIATYSQVGAAFRYGMLWSALICLPLASAVQETAARLGLTSGKGLATLIKERFPRPVLYLAVALVAAANSFNVGADLSSMGAAARLVIPVPRAVLVGAMTAGIVATEILVEYRTYAKVLRWLCLSLGAYVAVLFVVHVPWATVALRTVTPAVRWTRPALAALIAILGTTISPYLFFWQASEEVEEEHGPHGRVTKTHLRAMRVDVIAGMTSAVAVMFAIMVASSATLGEHGIRTVQTADQAARALQPIAGRAAGVLFALGVVGTGMLAVPVLAGSTAYALSEALGWHEGLSRHFRQAKGFYSVIIASTVLGLSLGLVHVDPIRALYYSAILNGLAAPPLLLLMLVLSRSKRAYERDAGGRVSEVLVGVAFVLMAALPVLYVLR